MHWPPSPMLRRQPWMRQAHSSFQSPFVPAPVSCSCRNPARGDDSDSFTFNPPTLTSNRNQKLPTAIHRLFTETRPLGLAGMLQPPATIRTISNRSPSCSWRLENSDGATASPLCSTTTLRGRRFCASRNSSIEHGNGLFTSRPFAVTEVSSARKFAPHSGRQRHIPIFPHRIVAETAYQVGHLLR